MTAEAVFASPGMLGPPPGPELAAAIEELHQAQHRFECELRAGMRRMAGITCTCVRWFDWGRREPPQIGCIVHGSLVMDHEGKIL